MKKIISITYAVIFLSPFVMAQDSTAHPHIAVIASFSDRASIGIRYWLSENFVLAPTLSAGYSNKNQKGIGSASDQTDKTFSFSGSCAIESHLHLQSFIMPFLHAGIETGVTSISHTPSLTSAQMTTMGQLLEIQTNEIPISIFAGIGFEGKITQNISLLFMYDVVGVATFNTTTQKSFKLNDNNTQYSVFDFKTNTSAVWISFLL